MYKIVVYLAKDASMVFTKGYFHMRTTFLLLDGDDWSTTDSSLEYWWSASKWSSSSASSRSCPHCTLYRTWTSLVPPELYSGRTGEEDVAENWASSSCSSDMCCSIDLTCWARYRTVRFWQTDNDLRMLISITIIPSIELAALLHQLPVQLSLWLPPHYCTCGIVIKETDHHNGDHCGSLFTIP